MVSSKHTKYIKCNERKNVHVHILCIMIYDLCRFWNSQIFIQCTLLYCYLINVGRGNIDKN